METVLTTLWEFIKSMENGLFADDAPLEKVRFLWQTVRLPECSDPKTWKLGFLCEVGALTRHLQRFQRMEPSAGTPGT
jgi:hypothetical protein